MKDPQTFWICFVLLERCYFATHLDGLGALLGALSPELWKDNLPSDPALFADWEALPPLSDKTQHALTERILLFLGASCHTWGSYADAFAVDLEVVRRWLAALSPRQYAEAADEAARRQSVWQQRREEACAPHTSF